MDDARRLSFGGVADLYDRRRPSYPSALIDDLLADAPAGEGPLRALEVGAGTGKATVLLAARGVTLDALEPSEAMAAVARRNTRAYPDVTITVTEFERWQRPGAPYPLLISAQAWHWIDPARRYALARAALVRSGLLAVWWNRPAWAQCPLREPLDEVYRRHAPELAVEGSPMRPLTGTPERWEAELAGVDGLTDPTVRTYAWQSEYSAQAYTELLATHSDHILLAPDRQAALLGGVGDVIESAGGVLVLPQQTRLCLARAA